MGHAMMLQIRHAFGDLQYELQQLVAIHKLPVTLRLATLQSNVG